MTLEGDAWLGVGEDEALSLGAERILGKRPA